MEHNSKTVGQLFKVVSLCIGQIKNCYIKLFDLLFPPLFTCKTNLLLAAGAIKRKITFSFFKWNSTIVS